MRRGVTVLVVVVVAAIALAAGIDALRGGSDSDPATETASSSSTTSGEPANDVPLEGGLGGTLYYTGASCELQAIELPAQKPAEAPNWDECRFVLSPNGRRVSGEGSGWDPRSDPLIGKLFQSQDGTIQVSTNRGPEGDPFPGTAPAWRPDGTLTYFADGAVREWPSGGVVLSQRDLVRALRGPFPELAPRDNRLRVREAAWLDDGRLAAIFSAQGPELGEITGGNSSDLLAIYDGTELDQVTFDGAGGLSELRTSPGGRYAAARSTGGRDSDFVMIESGRELITPRIVGYRTLAWSPDEQWVAIAADGGVFVHRPGAPGPPELELDLDAQDLAWRGEPGAPALAGAAEAQWLDRVGATGRLFLTHGPLSDCRLRALRIPDLEWEERPQGLPNPCRFTLDESEVTLPESVVPQPGGPETATCRGEAGCSIAWTPDGRPTFVRGGELLAGKPEDGPNELLVSRADLRRMFGRPSALEEIAWADDERFWAVVGSGESVTVVRMTRDRLVSSPSFTTRRIQDLRVSATGMVAAETDRGVVFFDTGGRRVLTFPNGQAVTWAPGQVIAAVATRSELLFVAPASGEIVTLPLAVRDLEWVVP